MAQKAYQKRKRPPAEYALEALGRAQQGNSITNYPAIYHGFTAKGIPESDILPRENVLTYAAWIAKGRQVRKGEHGVKVLTYIVGESEKQDEKTGETKVKSFKRPWTSTVFHVSQTEPMGDCVATGKQTGTSDTVKPVTAQATMTFKPRESSLRESHLAAMAELTGARHAG